MALQRAAVAVASVLFFPTFLLQAQSRQQHAGRIIRPKARITATIDDHVRMALRGNRHPLARPEREAGPAPLDRRMERMILVLDADPEQGQALEELLADQRNPNAARYQQWLTPESFGEQYGVSTHDLERVASWLRGHGLEVNEIPASRRAIVFSGSVAQVEAAFHTEMRAYYAGGELHYANGSDPEIPRALAGVVDGVVALHDFRSRPALAGLRRVTPQFNSGGAHYMGPGDFATIYDVAPLYQSAVDGTGQSIAVIGRSNILMSDVRAFRSYFGLPANDPTIILNGSDPGVLSGGEQSEAALDVEWAGAVGKNATVQFVVSASTGSSDGVNLSALYAVNHNVAPVMTLSFGACEAALGSSGNAWINSLWQQAAAQGITVLVSSGDSGAAGCDSASASTATHGAGVNGLCSSPYSVCVGGTEFSDTSNPGIYWSATTDPTSKSSALQYIPEMPWNDSGITTGGSGLWSAGGGASSVYTKPAWQTGSGVPADGRRDVPDVSLNASTHDGYLTYINGGLYASGGTSASAPALAGIMSLVNQKAGTRQGNANPTFYTLAASQQAGGAAVFHDVTTGNNSVPGLTGFNAGPGYDEAAGLGSVDAALLVNHWTDAAPAATPSLQVTLAPSSVSVTQGAGANINVNVGVSGGFNSAVVLSAAGLPAGVTASFTPASLNAPGSGSSILSLSSGAQAAPGSYPVQVTASGGGITQSGTLTLTITSLAGITVTPGVSSLNIIQGKAATTTVAVSVTGGFKAAVTLSASGLPSGMTATLTPAKFASPGSGTSMLKLTAAAQTAVGTYTIQVNATGGGKSQSASLAVTVAPPPSFTMTGSAASVSLLQGASVTVDLTTTVANGFNSGITLTAASLPSGVTAAYSPSSLAAPGAGTSTLTLRASATARTGSFTIRMTAAGGGLAVTLPLVVTVAPPPSFALTAGAKSLSVLQGASSVVNLNMSVSGGFNFPIALTASGLPSGVSAGWSVNPMPAPGAGTSVVTLSADPAAPAATQIVTFTATGGGVTKTVSLTLAVKPPPSFTLKQNATSANLTQGLTASVVLTVTGLNGFTSGVVFSVSGLPSGVTASFSPSSVAGSGTHNSSLRLVAASSASTGPATLTVTASGGGITNTATVALNVAARTH